MNKNQFKQITKSNILLPAFIFDKDINVYEVFSEHVEAGANVLVAPTYLFNNKKSKEKAIKETIKASGDKTFVAGAVFVNSEKTVFSDGRISYDAYYEIIKEEVKFIHQTHPMAVMFLLGFDSIVEAKCAVYATKEVCDLPICLMLDTYDDKTLADGTDIHSAVITMQSLGVSALGFGGADIDSVYDVLLSAKEFACVPLFAVPDGNGFIAPFEFSEYAHDFINNKCVMFAGGKNTDSKFTAQIAKELWQLQPFMPDFPTVNAICGKKSILFMDFENNVVSKNKELIEIDLEGLKSDNEVDEMILKIKKADFPPVCFKSKELELLERAMKVYPGRVAIKSDEYGEISAKEYGAIILNQGEE